MGEYKIRRIFESSYADYCTQKHVQSDVQRKTAHAILNCKSGRLGVNLSQCTNCEHIEIHNNSCRNRNCPNCQAVLKEIWVDKRRAEVIDTPYFHVVFTLPHELNSLIYCNQKLLYGLFTDAAPKHFLNYLRIRNGLERHPASSRCSIHGIRRWITMYICTASFPVEGLQRWKAPKIF